MSRGELQTLLEYFDRRFDAVEKKLVRLEELAASEQLIVSLRRARTMLRMTSKDFWRAVREGEIPTIRRAGRRPVVDVAALRAYVAKSSRTLSARAGARAEVATSGRPGRAGTGRASKKPDLSILEIDLETCA